MRLSRISMVSCGLAYALVVMVGCGSKSATPKDGGTGGTSTTGGTTGTGGRSGSGGVVGATGGTVGNGGGGSGGANTNTDAGADRTDGGDGATGPCTTTFGPNNPVQFAFNGGANNGWYQYVGATSDLANSGLTTSLGASFTDGNSCPGALQFAVNFTAYGPPNGHGESGSTEIFYGAPPNGKNWSPYKNLHAWIKMQTADFLGIDGVYF